MPRRASVVPPGLWSPSGDLIPAMNRWAIVACPSGALLELRIMTRPQNTGSGALVPFPLTLSSRGLEEAWCLPFTPSLAGGMVHACVAMYDATMGRISSPGLVCLLFRSNRCRDLHGLPLFEPADR